MQPSLQDVCLVILCPAKILLLSLCCICCKCCNACVLQPPYKVGLDNPKKTILVEVMKATAAISVVEDYKLLGKLNLRELSMIGDDDDKKDKIASTAAEQPEPEPTASTVAEGQSPADSADQKPSSAQPSPASTVVPSDKTEAKNLFI